MPNKAALLNEINETSFAVNDLTLYLDTHPDDAQALSLFTETSGRRRAAMKEFAENFYPLTIDCIHNVTAPASWAWNDGPAPWEGGMQ